MWNISITIKKRKRQISATKKNKQILCLGVVQPSSFTGPRLTWHCWTRIGTLPCTWPAARYTLVFHKILRSQDSLRNIFLLTFYYYYYCFFLFIYLFNGHLFYSSGSWDVRPADFGRDPQSHSDKCHQQCSANVRTWQHFKPTIDFFVYVELDWYPQHAA